MIKELTFCIPHVKKEGNVNRIAWFQKKIKFIIRLEQLEPRRYL